LYGLNLNFILSSLHQNQAFISLKIFTKQTREKNYGKIRAKNQFTAHKFNASHLLFNIILSFAPKPLKMSALPRKYKSELRHLHFPLEDVNEKCFIL